MIEPRRALASVLLVAGVFTAAANAQDKPADQNAAPPIPLKIQVVISRYQDDKKISSLPYAISTNAGAAATLRMGATVPVATSYTPPSTSGAAVNPVTSFQYRDVGTNIDCTSAALGDGRFRLALTVEDSSIYPDDRPSSSIERPSFRSFRASNSLVLRDGQTSQLTTAVDKVTGIVTRVDVTLNVAK